LASARSYHGDYAGAGAAAEEGVAVSRAIADKPLESLHLTNLARSMHVRGQVETARELYGLALGLAREAGYARMRTRALFYLGLLNHEQGEIGAARVRLQESLDSAREVDDRIEIERVLVALARLAAEQRDLNLARQHLTEAVGLARELGHQPMLTRCLAVLTRVLVAQRRPAQALQLAAAVNAFNETRSASANPEITADLSFSSSEARRAVGDVDANAALAVGRMLSVDQAITCGFVWSTPTHMSARADKKSQRLAPPWRPCWMLSDAITRRQRLWRTTTPIPSPRLN
jgi:tetratricopeptide (TPR) repeat protein